MIARVLGPLVQRGLSRARRVTEGLLGIKDNRLCSAVSDLSGNNPSVAYGDTSLYTREARIMRIVH